MENIKELKEEPSKVKSTLGATVDKEIVASPVDNAIDKALFSIVKGQDPKGFWCYELECDVTIPSEYIFMMHYIGDIDNKIQNKTYQLGFLLQIIKSNRLILVVLQT